MIVIERHFRSARGLAEITGRVMQQVIAEHRLPFGEDFHRSIQQAQNIRTPIEATTALVNPQTLKDIAAWGSEHATE